MLLLQVQAQVYMNFPRNAQELRTNAALLPEAAEIASLLREDDLALAAPLGQREVVEEVWQAGEGGQEEARGHVHAYKAATAPVPHSPMKKPVCTVPAIQEIHDLRGAGEAAVVPWFIPTPAPLRHCALTGSGARGRSGTPSWRRRGRGRPRG